MLDILLTKFCFMKNKLMCYPQQLGRSWKVFVPEPSGTLSAMCTGQLSNFVCYLHRNHPELHGPSAPGPSELDQPSGTLQHLISHLRRNRPEPHQLFARNRLRRNPPEPHQPSAPEGSGTLRNLLRNLVLQLHRIAPELFWAKDPIASFAVGEKMIYYILIEIVIQLLVANILRQNKRLIQAGRCLAAQR